MPRILAGLPRREPPDLPVEAVFELWRRRRRRKIAAAALGVAGLVLAGLFAFRSSSPGVPAYLDLYVVDVDNGPAESPQPAPLAAISWPDQPAELEGP